MSVETGVTLIFIVLLVGIDLLYIGMCEIIGYFINWCFLDKNKIATPMSFCLIS
jgi:uncharacterized membrane protein HdeD (DUF308 family)